MATFYVESKVDLMILVDDSRNEKTTKKCLLYCLVFNVVLFMSLEMLLRMIIMLSKIQYTRSLFQILMGSIGMSRHGGMGLLATT